MALDTHLLKMGLMTASLFAATLPFGILTQAGEPDGFFEYKNTALRGVVAAETITSVETCSRLCGARSGCVGYDHRQSAGSCRIFASVSGAQDETGRFAATRLQVSNYREPDNRRSESVELLRSEWNHNGSIMVLQQSPARDGSTGVEILYQTPKGELLGVGIRPGSILFKGVLSEGILSGRARLSSRKCGIIEYEVEGLFDPSSEVPFFLHGAAPKRDSDCTVHKWVETGGNANLRFNPS